MNIHELCSVLPSSFHPFARRMFDTSKKNLLKKILTMMPKHLEVPRVDQFPVRNPHRNDPKRMTILGSSRVFRVTAMQWPVREAKQ